MTAPDRNRAVGQPLWSDERITEWVREHWQGAGSAEAIAADMRDEYESERAALKQDRLQLGQRVLDENWRAWEFQAELQELRTVAAAALAWIDEIYPADIFDGSSGDEGPLRIVAIRENLRRALQEPTP